MSRVFPRLSVSPIENVERYIRRLFLSAITPSTISRFSSLSKKELLSPLSNGFRRFPPVVRQILIPDVKRVALSRPAVTRPRNSPRNRLGYLFAARVVSRGALCPCCCEVPRTGKEHGLVPMAPREWFGQRITKCIQNQQLAPRERP